jgi:hypothetical protein
LQAILSKQKSCISLPARLRWVRRVRTGPALVNLLIIGLSSLWLARLRLLRSEREPNTAKSFPSGDSLSRNELRFSSLTPANPLLQRSWYGSAGAFSIKLGALSSCASRHLSHTLLNAPHAFLSHRNRSSMFHSTWCGRFVHLLSSRSTCCSLTLVVVSMRFVLVLLQTQSPFPNCSSKRRALPETTGAAGCNSTVGAAVRIGG